MALSPRVYRQQRIEKLQRQVDDIRDRKRSGDRFPWEIKALDQEAKEILAEIEELKKPTVTERPTGIKVAYGVAVVFMAWGLLTESHGTFMFGVFALIVGLLGAVDGIGK